MSEEQKKKELEYIEEKLLSILQIINERRASGDDAITLLGKIIAKTEFALDRVKRLKDEA